MIFGVRMALKRKGIWVKYGHKSPQPEWLSFSGVASREKIRITITYASLNDLPVFGAIIQNAYLQYPR